MRTIVMVTDEQIEAAKALIRISGGTDKVAPLIAKIASAPPATPDQMRAWRRTLILPPEHQ